MGEAVRKESSMEDILASIRKIISSDTPSPPPKEATQNEDAVNNGSSLLQGHASMGTTQSDLNTDLQLQEKMVHATDPIKVPHSAKQKAETEVIPKTDTKKSPPKPSMSSTLEGIRAAVGRTKADEEKNNNSDTAVAEPVEKPLTNLLSTPLANPVAKSISKPVSTSATPLAPSNTDTSSSKLNGNVNSDSNSSVGKSKVSLSDLAEKIKNENNTDNDLVYTDPVSDNETSKVEQVEPVSVPEPQLDAILDAESIASENISKSNTASELNFKAFANSIEKPTLPSKPAGEFVSDDVEVFAAEDAEKPGDSEDDNEAVNEQIIVDETSQATNVSKEVQQDFDRDEVKSAVLRGQMSDVAPVSQPAELSVDEPEDAPIKELAKEPISNAISNSKVSNTIAQSVRAAVRGDAIDTELVDNPLIDNQPDMVTSILPETTSAKPDLISPATKTAVVGSIDRLKQSMEDVNTAHVENVLRPMLREWLDNNLPEMVEKIVREEISFITQNDKN